MSQPRLTSTPVVRMFDTEWDEQYSTALIDLDDHGVQPGAEWLRDLNTGEVEHRDIVLLELLRKAQAGNVAAERTIIKSMLPKIIAHARSVFRRFDTWDDCTAVAMASAWEVVHTLSTDRAATRLRRTLGMEILHRLTRAETTPKHADTPTEDDQLNALIESANPEQDPYAASTNPMESLVKVLVWAVDAGVVSREDVAFIARADLGDKSIVELAEEAGENYNTYFRRIARARKRLTDAIGEHMSRYVSWE